MLHTSTRRAQIHHQSHSTPFTRHIFIILISIFIYVSILIHRVNTCVTYENKVQVSTYIGKAASGFAQGNKATAEFTDLYGIAADSAGHLYVTDHGNCVVRKIDRSDPTNPIVSDYMGSYCSPMGIGSTGPGTGIGAGLFKKGGASEGHKDIVYSKTSVGEFLYVIGYHNIRRIDISDPETPILGYGGTSPFAGTGNEGFDEGARGVGQLYNPAAMVPVTSSLGNGLFPEGSLLVADGDSMQLRVVSPTGGIEAWSGMLGGAGLAINGQESAGGDAPLAVNGVDPVSYVGLQGVAFDDDNNVYVCDYGPTSGSVYSIRKILPNGFAYIPPVGDHFLGNSPLHCDGVGSAVSLKNPKKLVRDPEGFFIFIDEYRIRRLTITASGEGQVSTLAGTDNNQIQDGVGSAASFKNPRALTIFNNTIYVVCDTHVRAVEFVTPSVPNAPTIVAYNSTDVTVQFGTSEFDGGPVFYHYLFSVRRMDTMDVVQTYTAKYAIDASLPQHTFSGLTPGVVYRVFSQGVNRVGHSAESSGVEFTTPLHCYGISFDNSTVCSGHGTCIVEDSCDCQTEYSGDQCEVYSCYDVASTNPSVCSGRGDCVASNVCACQQPGIYGAQCQIAECYGVNSTQSSVCSSHGTCIDYNQCQCDANYADGSCSYYTCFGVPHNTTDTSALCSGRGSCVGHNNCSCVSGYGGTECEAFACFGTVSSSSSVCSGHGDCVAPNNCSCQPLYGGADCNVFSCFGVANSDNTVCSSHGSCVAQDVCSCQSGHGGTECEWYDCFGFLSNDTSRVCSGHGTCTAPGTCACVGGFSGDDCSSAVCFGETGDSACSGPGRGYCSGLDNCTCHDRVLGDECEYFMCFTRSNNDPLVCSQHGSCMNVDFCSCDEGYTDSECENLLCHGYSAAHPQVCSGHGSCDAYDQCTCSSSYYFGTHCNSTLYNSFVVTPVSGDHIVTAFQFGALSYAFPSTSGFTYRFYFVDPVNGEKEFVSSAVSDNYFYPPVNGEQVLIGAEITTPKGLVIVNQTVRIEKLSEQRLANKEELLLDTGSEYNLQTFYTRGCTARDYAANLLYLRSSVDVAYQCSDPLFSIDAQDYASYNSFERNLITSTSPQCSLDELFRLNPLSRTTVTLRQHARILECISAHTKDPSYLVSHLRQYIVTAASPTFTEDTLTQFLVTISQIVDFLTSPEGKSDRAQSLIHSNHIIDLLRQLSQKMESFVGLTTTFPTVISSTNAHIALARNTLSQLTSTFSSYEIGTSKGALRITLPLNFVSPPSASTVLSLRAAVFEYDTFQWKNFDPESNITSIILSLQVYSPLSTNPLDIQGLTSGNLVRLSIPGTFDISKVQRDTSRDRYMFECQTWNAANEAWEVDGCSLVDSLSSGSRMVCDCAKISGLVGVGLKFYAAPTNSSNNNQDPDIPLPPSVVGTTTLDFLQSNWMLIAGILLALVILVIISFCCMACCLMGCMFLTRSRGRKEKQIQPVVLDTHQLKGLHAQQGWDDMMAHDNFSDDSLSDDSSSDSDLEIMETERTTESSSSPNGEDLDEEAKAKREEQRELDKKRRKEKERRRKVKEMKRMHRMLQKSSSMPKKRNRKDSSLSKKSRKGRHAGLQELRPDSVVRVERMDDDMTPGNVDEE